MHGHSLLESIHSLPTQTHVAVILRHAERFPILTASDHTLAELTPDGHAAAEAWGTRISGFDKVRLFHSPVKRCRQTAEGIARGLGATGRVVEIVGAAETLGVDYVVDHEEMARLATQHGEHFIRLWFSGEAGPAVMRAADQVVTRKLAYLTERLHEPGAHGRRLDLHVSHDWNILTLRELLCGVRHEEAGWLDFLDGVAFSSSVDGLRAVYRDRAVTRRLPWAFPTVLE
jgi:broad specificity phosphatase PhoE